MKLLSLNDFMRLSFTTMLSLSLLTACSPSEEVTKDVVRPVKLYEVTGSGSGVTREFPAIVSANRKAVLSFRIPGELDKFPVTSGIEVKEGEVLARLDDRDIKNEVAARQADFDLASSEFQRIKSLRAKKVVSQSEFDNANAALKAAKVKLQLAKDKLSDTVLTAPFAGRIAKTMVENHQYVQAQDPVMVLQDNKRLEIKIQMPESIIGQINESEIDRTYRPVVMFSSHPNIEYRATYKKHATEVTPGTQSYEVVFSMPTPKNFIVYSGMGGKLVFDLSRVIKDYRAGAGHVVPMTAVLKDDSTGKVQVWVFNPDTQTVAPREVTLGRVTQSGVTVESGLKKGDQVVSAGLNRLREGMKVKPLTHERGV